MANRIKPPRPFGRTPTLGTGTRTRNRRAYRPKGTPPGLLPISKFGWAGVADLLRFPPVNIGATVLDTSFGREQYHWLLLVMDMDYQAPEQSGKEGQPVLFLANDHLLNPRSPPLLLPLIVRHRIH